MHRGQGGGFAQGGGRRDGGRGDGDSVGRCCLPKNHMDPGPRGSAAHFLLGMEMEREQPVQEIDLSVEDILLDIKDSNKCQCPPPIVKLNPVDDDQVDKVKLAKKKMPKRRKIYGRNQK